jgi:L-2-hydroxyglutarate oxidase LhgO
LDRSAGAIHMSAADFDVVVVGAGVVGLAVARACALTGHQVLVLETADCVGSGVSSRNSEVIHAGLYYPVGSYKALLCVRGREALYEYCAARGIPHRRCGKLVVAAEPSQHPRLETLFQQAARNGVRDLVWLSGEAVRQLEPEVACTRAFLSPSTGIVDSHALMMSLVADIEAHGGWVALQTEFEGAVREHGVFRITTRSGDEPSAVSSRWLINSAALQATRVAQRVRGLSPAFIPKSYLAKGHYFSVNGRPFSRLIYPLPVEGGLGIHATVQLDGQVRFGPDVEWVDTVSYDVDATRAAQFYTAIRTYWPGLLEGALQPAYAGLRPKISGPGEPSADFGVSAPNEHGLSGLINLFGIESPGLTASLALGDACARLVRS